MKELKCVSGILKPNKTSQDDIGLYTTYFDKLKKDFIDITVLSNEQKQIIFNSLSYSLVQSLAYEMKIDIKTPNKESDMEKCKTLLNKF